MTKKELRHLVKTEYIDNGGTYFEVNDIRVIDENVYMVCSSNGKIFLYDTGYPYIFDNDKNLISNIYLINFLKTQISSYIKNLDNHSNTLALTFRVIDDIRQEIMESDGTYDKNLLFTQILNVHKNLWNNQYMIGLIFKPFLLNNL